MAPILNAEIISTDLIREKIYGDENFQGEWSEIKLEVQNQIINCLKNKKDFIIDATHAKRDWRLSITQNLNLSYEIEWFGWWLKTPKLKCYSITHTFSSDKLPPSQTSKKFFVTHLNNANKLFCTLECTYKDFFDQPFRFDTQYFNNCRIITQPDMQSYYHTIGETIE